MPRWLSVFIFAVYLSGCVSLSMWGGYSGPPTRPDSIEKYYSEKKVLLGHETKLLRKGQVYKLQQITLDTAAGPVKIDYFQRKEKSDSVVFVFPVLGGRKNLIENYFADYFARNGFDAAIIHRSNEFKKPENVDHLEELLRLNVVRDRIAMDFFEQQYQKTKFASFGISRGAINVAMTAGVDKRLAYNVMALGGTDLVKLFRDAKENRIQNYVKTVTATRGVTRDQFFDFLSQQIKTDPKYLAQFLDAKRTLLVLAALDTTVPFKYGLKLRRQIGNPKTIVLLADHFTSLLYTQMASSFVPPVSALGGFPFDYVEGQAVEFYREKLNSQSTWWRNLPLKLIQFPLNFITEVGREIFEDHRTEPQKVDEGLWR